MPTTHSLIASQTLTSTSASISFTSIPQTFTDLKIVFSGRVHTNGDPTSVITFNSNTSNYKYITLFGDGSSASTFNEAAISNTSSAYIGYANGANSTANTFSNSEIYIQNYASSSIYKSINVDTVYETNATGGYVFLVSNLWSNTSPITSIQIKHLYGSNFYVGTSVYLYGISSDTAIQNKSVPYASGGNIVYSDGSYWYHAFTKSDNFIPWKSLTADILVVAGGGSGGIGYGNQAQGGGGAGGLLAFTSQPLVSQTVYSAIIGAGGPGTSIISTQGNNGSNSKFGSLTTCVGGGGGAAEDASKPGKDGGSGGGGFNSTVGQATSGQGNNGGAGGAANNGGGGGGGAGGAGGAYSGANGGSGGTGTGSFTSWATATGTGVNGYFASGGGGAAGGSGGSGGSGTNGGGSGSSTNTNNAGSGVANTGSGGGGTHCNPGTSGSGGSGIIIVRYAV